MCIQCSVCMEALSDDELWVVYNPPMCSRCERRRCPLCCQYVNTQDEILDVGIAHHVDCFLNCVVSPSSCQSSRSHQLSRGCSTEGAAGREELNMAIRPRGVELSRSGCPGVSPLLGRCGRVAPIKQLALGSIPTTLIFTGLTCVFWPV